MGKLGKPQKSRKNKKIKKVESSVEGDDNSRRKKYINMAPKMDDFQEIPRKVQYIIDKKGNFKSLKRRRRKENEPKVHDVENFHMERGVSEPMRSVPIFVKGKKEREKAFLNRVENETKQVLLKTKLSEKYKVDFEKLEKGQVVKKKGMSEKKKSRLKEKKTKQKQKRKDYKEDKKGEFSDFQDKIGFGEVVHAPPLLKTKPRKVPQDSKVQRPGKKSLLLKEIIAGNAESSPSGVGGIGKREIGQTLKRKNMSMAQQVKMDAEREKAIQMYRQNKKIKLS